MAKNSVADWDETPSGNTDIAGIDIAENCLAANLNDMGRNIMAQSKVKFNSLDTSVSALAVDAHTHANKAILDAITASFTTAQATKLTGIETGADVTDATNVAAAGALMAANSLSDIADADTGLSNLGGGTAGIAGFKRDYASVVYPVRNANTATEAAGLADGTIVNIAGFDYLVDSSATGTGSATNDLSVNGLVPFGPVCAEHFGASASATATENTARLQAALDLAQGPVWLAPDTVYPINDILLPPPGSGFDTRGGQSVRATLQLANGAAGAVLFKATKTAHFSNVIVDTSLVTGNDHFAVALLGVWHLGSTGVKLVGPGATVPGVGITSYGLVMRSLYSAAYTPATEAADFDALASSAYSINFGSYYNDLSTWEIDTFSYGRLLSSKEDGGSSRVNQNKFSAISITSCWKGTVHTGCGGGNVDYDVSQEAITSDCMTVTNQATGTAPVVIGGEMTSTGGNLYVGPGVLINIAGLTTPTANGAGEQALHIRSTGASTGFFGKAFSSLSTGDIAVSGTVTTDLTGASRVQAYGGEVGWMLDTAPSIASGASSQITTVGGGVYEITAVRNDNGGINCVALVSMNNSNNVNSITTVHQNGTDVTIVTNGSSKPAVQNNNASTRTIQIYARKLGGRT